MEEIGGEPDEPAPVEEPGQGEEQEGSATGGKRGDHRRVSDGHRTKNPGPPLVAGGGDGDGAAGNDGESGGPAAGKEGHQKMGKFVEQGAGEPDYNLPSRAEPIGPPLDGPQGRRQDDPREVGG